MEEQLTGWRLLGYLMYRFHLDLGQAVESMVQNNQDMTFVNELLGEEE
tara:strand:- start:108 stop:251 length:144 start_codon:yes stop_codon:yes gene_type:complete